MSLQKSPHQPGDANFEGAPTSGGGTGKKSGETGGHLAGATAATHASDEEKQAGMVKEEEDDHLGWLYGQFLGWI